MEHHHKGWPLAILGMAGTVGSWIVDHGFGVILGLASLVSIVFAIKASRSAQLASDEEARLARLKSNYLICGDCIRDELTTPPEECPHPGKGPFPKGCMKNNPFLGKSFFILVLCLLGMSLHAQTNAPAVPDPATLNANAAWAATVAEDVRKLVYDFLSGISFAGLLQVVFATYLGAKWLRNYTSLGGAGKIGSLLHLLNLERTASALPLSPANPPSDKPTQ